MTEGTEVERVVEELTLLLLYLTSWEEELVPGAPKVHRTWKNHRFEILDALVQQGYLETSHRSKSVRITKDGVEKARQLQKKYLERQRLNYSPAPTTCGGRRPSGYLSLRRCV